MFPETTRRTALVASAALAFALRLASQSAYSSNVEGIVTDPQSAAVPNIQVRLQNTQTQVDYATTTSASGYYRFSSIAPGQYEIVIAAPGFARAVTNVALTANETRGVDVALKLASQGASVTVVENAAALNPDETSIALTLRSSDLTALPLQNGGTLNVLKVLPGVSGVIENSTNLPIANTTNSYTPQVYGNGRPGASNLFTVDGLPLNSVAGTNINKSSQIDITPNPDMLAEVSVQTKTYSVENSNSSSVQTDFVTKSGANRVHGDVDYIYSGQFLVATPTFASPSSPFRKSWITGALGGPVIKNRTFFFGSFQNENQVSSGSGVQDFLTPQFIAWAQQTFPNSVNLSHTFAKFQPVPSTYAVTGINKTAQTSFGPQNLAANTGCGTPSTFNIPCNLPIDELANFNQTPSVKGTQYNVRLDQYLREAKDRIYLAYFRVDQTSNALLYIPQFNQYSPSTAQYKSAGYTHIFTPTLLNEANFGWLREWDQFGGGTQQYGVLPYGFNVCCNGPSTISLFTFYGPEANREHIYALRDSVNWIKNKHSLKFGFQLQHSNYLQDRDGVNSRPQNASFCCSLFSFLEDAPPQSYSLSTLSGQTGAYVPQFYGAAVTTEGIYVQDEWKVTPNLFLTFGLRWDNYGNPAPYSIGLPFAQVFLGSGSTLEQQVAGAYTKIVKNTFNGPLNKNFMPRAGFAWSPRGDQRWSVRGGFGLFEDSIGLANVTAALPTNPPERLSANLSVFSPNPAFIPSLANVYGTSTSGPPWGYTYPSLPVLGTDSRGGVISGYNAQGQAVLYPASLSGVARNLTPQKTANFSLSVQRQLAANLVAGAGYSGSYSWNQIYSPGDLNTFAGDLLDGVLNRLTPEWGSINYLMQGLNSHYNALIATMRQRLGTLSWQASYTWSRTIGDPIDQSFPLPYAPKAYYGAQDIDYPQRFSFSLTYELRPHTGRRLFDNVVGGWTISALGLAQSGGPFSVVCTSSYPTCDYNADGYNYDFPNVRSGVETGGFSRSQYENNIFPAGTFTKPAPGAEGNEGRNIFRNPGYFSIDSSVSKVFRLPWEGVGFRFSFETFNTLNRVNLGAVDATITDATFGRSTTANQARVMMLRGRVDF